MVSKEPNHLPSVQSHCNGNPEKAPTVVTVRSVLLNRNSPDIESRLKRRRSRTQQVRFKDLDNDSETWDSVEKVRSKSPNEAPNWQKEYSNGPSLVGAVRGDMEKTIGAVTAFIKRAPPHPLTPGPTRRSWVPTHPCSLTLPLPTQPCRSTAIQTSPSLQKPPLFSATQTRSHSLGGGWDDEDSSDELTAQVYVTPSRSRKKHDQCCTKKTENTDNVSISTTKTSSSPQKHSRRRGRRKPLSRAASDPGKREPACNSPTETVDKIPPESFHSTQVPSKDVKQESLNITSPQCTPNNNAGHNTCSISSKQPESRNCKVHTMPDSTASSQAVDVDHASSVTPSTAPLPQTSCLKESQCCPTESTCLTPTVPVSTSAQVMSAVAMPSTHEKTCSSPTKSTRICSTPSVRDCTSPKKPGSQSNPDPHSEPTPPVQSRNSFPVSEETTLSPKDTDSKPPNCSLEEPAIPITSSSITPHMKTLPKASSIASKEPVQPVIIPTQSVSPIQSVPNCNIPSQKEYVADSLDLPVHTLPTSTPVQPTTSCKFAQESLPRCTKENPVSFGSPKQPFTTQKTPTQIHPHNVIPFTPHSVTPNPFPMSTAAHIIPIAQTAVNYLFQNKSTNVTPCKPVLICNPSTQPAPCLPSSSLALQNSGMQNAVSCSSSPQVVHHVKAAAQTVSHSKSFPQNMSPILSQHEAKVHANKPQETVLPSANFRHSLPPYNPQNVLLFNNSGASPSPPQAFYYTQERRDRFILPPPPPPPPPYTPRKEGTSTPGQPRKPTVPKAASSITEKNGDKTAIEKSSSQAGTHRQVAETPPPIPPKTKARATVRPTCLSNQRAILGPGSQPNENHLAAAIGFNPQRPLGPAEGQGDTLRQVQELLGGLMSGAKCKLDLAKAKEKLFGPNGPLYDIGVLQSQLHSLEGVLETSQNTIKVLLDVIQDLEKKEAERDGRHTYRTGQDIENCGTCRDCACIIYSVEHDFRLQEGQVTKAWKVPEHQEAEQGSPQMVVPPPRQQEAPQALQSIKKSRRKCFWFL